jgi:MFS family permease
MTAGTSARPRLLLDMNGYQWGVLFAAWLGWGFDIFDGLLFSFVAPNCVPTLLGLEIGSPAAKAATAHWNGVLSSTLLIGWAVGGILFGKIADRLGRTKTLLLTMLLYSLGTAMCAFANSMEMLLLFRIFVSLGIGGEWAAGASMVAEVVPERRRIEAGALLYTSAPVGLLAASFVSKWFVGGLFPDRPDVSWRYLFLMGLLPALVAFVVRFFIKEPERWERVKDGAGPRLRELFTPHMRRRTIGGLLLAFVALLSWWSCNVFINVYVTAMAQAAGAAQGLEKASLLALTEDWKLKANLAFNFGGLIGTLFTVPVAKHLGRRTMFAIYFVLSAAALLCAFGLQVPDTTRLWLYFPIGLSVFGVFGSFTYYLPELYPTRLRGTGAGFTYNTGRLVAAVGPFLVGTIAQGGLADMRRALFAVGFVPIVGLLVLPLAMETRGRELED